MVEAETSFRQAVERAPDLSQPWSNLGQALLAQFKFASLSTFLGGRASAGKNAYVAKVGEEVREFGPGEGPTPHDVQGRDRRDFPGFAAMGFPARFGGEPLKGLPKGTAPAALARLPVLRKSELIERQKEKFEDRDPFGGLTAPGDRRRAGAPRSPARRVCRCFLNCLPLRIIL